MSDEKFWILCWLLLSTVIVVVASIFGYNVYVSNENSKQVTLAAIAKGENPIAAQCAMQIGRLTTGESAICAVTAKK